MHKPLAPRHLGVALALAAAAAFHAPAFAQAAAGASAAPAAAPAPVSAAKKELIARVLKLQQPMFEALGPSLAARLSTQVMQMAGQVIGRLPADRRDAVARDVQTEVKKFHDDIAPVLKERTTKIAPQVLQTALEEKFTEDELKSLATWLESSASRKWMTIGGDVQMQLEQKVAAETRGTVQPKLQALEKTLSEKLRVASQGAPASAAPKGPKR